MTIHKKCILIRQKRSMDQQSVCHHAVPVMVSVFFHELCCEYSSYPTGFSSSDLVFPIH